MKKLILLATMIVALIAPVKSQEIVEINNECHVILSKLDNNFVMLISFTSDRPVFFKRGGMAIITTKEGNSHTFTFMFEGYSKYDEEVGKYIIGTPFLFGDFSFLETENLKHIFIETTKESPYHITFSVTSNIELKKIYNKLL